ncbi:MAG TPA: hypothetical protein VH196_09340, partial [Terriglobales bacterium]|nr:hypothetical protein [Terriglobales bacterium]
MSALAMAHRPYALAMATVTISRPKRVLSSLTLQIPRQLFLIPLGPGETKPITHDSIDRSNARFLPDGRNVV